MMHDDWHTTTYLTYHDGQQAVTGHWRCHWDRRLCSRPPGSASLTSLAHSMMVTMGGFPCPLHLCILNLGERVGFTMPGLSLKCFSQKSRCKASDWI